MKNIALSTRHLLIVNRLQKEKGRYVMVGELLRHVNKELEFRGREHSPLTLSDDTS